MSYSPWGLKESDTTEELTHTFMCLLAPLIQQVFDEHLLWRNWSRFSELN